MGVSDISNSYAAGNAKGSHYVGGFVGGSADDFFDDFFDDFVGDSVVDLGIGSITDSFYIGSPNLNDNTLGIHVLPSKLMQINTFKTNGGYVSADWDISDSPDSTVIWYISEGQDYPKFYYYSFIPQSLIPSPSDSKGSGSSTGSATIIGNTVTQNNTLQNNTPQNNTPQNNTPQNNTPQNNTPQNNTPQNNTPQNNTPNNPSNDSTEQKNSKSFIWWGLGAVLLIAIVGGIVYVFYFKKK